MDKWFDNKEERYRKKPERERLIKKSIEASEKFVDIQKNRRIIEFLKEHKFSIIYLIIVISILCCMLK